MYVDIALMEPEFNPTAVAVGGSRQTLILCKLQEVFGEDATVRLDVFHAVQRITRKIPKRHPFSSECMNDFTMVYRSPTDITKKGKQSTPCPAIIMKKLEDFITKWHKCELHGWKVLNDAALRFHG